MQKIRIHRFVTLSCLVVSIKPQIDLNEMNTASAWGARKSMAMNWEEVDQTPMFELNEIIWKSVKGPESPMPPPVRSFHFNGR